jgi:hypothetical protein
MALKHAECAAQRLGRQAPILAENTECAGINKSNG